MLTPPFLPELLQSLRMFRLLRVVRVARLLRLAPIFRRAFTLQGLRYATVFTVLVVITGAAAFHSTEPNVSFFDSIYWAVTTVTTVGYGEPHPVSTEGKVLAMLLMVVGIGYFAVVTGAVADRFVQRTREEEREEADAEVPDDVAAQVDRLAARLRELVADAEALRLALPANGRDDGDP